MIWDYLPDKTVHRSVQGFCKWLATCVKAQGQFLNSQLIKYQYLHGLLTLHNSCCNFSFSVSDIHASIIEGLSHWIAKINFDYVFVLFQVIVSYYSRNLYICWLILTWRNKIPAQNIRYYCIHILGVEIFLAAPCTLIIHDVCSVPVCFAETGKHGKWKIVGATAPTSTTSWGH